MNLFLFSASLVALRPAAAFTVGFAPVASHAPAPNSPTRLDAESVAADGVANGTDRKKVIVLGGDGFCGWPTSLYLSDQGHDVVVVDNLSRRNIDTELGCDSLTPIQSPDVSVARRALRALMFECIRSLSFALCEHSVCIDGLVWKCLFLYGHEVANFGTEWLFSYLP